MHISSLYKYGISNCIGINFSLIVQLETLGYIFCIYERKNSLTVDCGIDLVGVVLYGKWKICLLWFINEGFRRPCELQRKIPDASPKGFKYAAKRVGTT